jgi:predicted XRE-type DNA-binding protein
MKARVTASSGNVFRDLGFSADEAEHLRVRSDLMISVQKAIASRGMTQAQAANLLGVTQPRISDLVRGRLDLFSIETLIDMLAHLGIRVKLVLQPPRKRAGVA